MSRSKRKSALCLLLPYIRVCISKPHESYWSLTKKRLIFCPLLSNFGFSLQIFISYPYHILWKSAQLGHVDRPTWRSTWTLFVTMRTRLKSAYHANVPMTISILLKSMCICILALLIGHRNITFFCVVLYYSLWPVWLYHYLPHYLINSTTFIKKRHWSQDVFRVSLQVLS